ncbi:MAG: tRNA uridine-5-carboxymethylaminomethyl(34) synthesis GTPase MnmE [Clostridiales bacterium]|nr:tRNA uridine-5-carboxymethylaminomethyl(34) synthesis GTPase MnmE [Clostridiales bacterium]
MEQNAMTNDTICAISTPGGVGGIAVARVSGHRAIEIVDSLWTGRRLVQVDSHTAHLGTIRDTHGEILDQVVATVFRSPRSFTGDDVVEISMHGSRYIQREMIATLCKAGCRLAERGEFTRRAFASGRVDLAEAEGIADMIASDSRAAHRAAITQMRGRYSEVMSQMRQRLVDLASLLELELDFSEEEVEFASRSQLMSLAEELYVETTRLRDSYATGNAIKQGIPVAIIGATNAGKSSLLNAITGDDRAIVSDIHGTTRDVVDDLVTLGDYQFRFQDTAGLRDTTDDIERIGIERSRKAATNAHMIIYMVDAVFPQIDSLASAVKLNTEAPLLILVNKKDMVDDDTISSLTDRFSHAYPQSKVMGISTRSRQDIDRLVDLLVATIDERNASQEILVTNARHHEALERAAQAISRIIEGLRTQLSGDLIAQDVRETIHHLNTITGTTEITTDTLLQTIFNRFCIGK